MGRTATVRQGRPLQRHRIVERPRLFALLDDSSARIRTLIAPAGYGKTTLGEQWIRRDGRRGAWYTARASSTDVAALALGIARAATALVPDCDLRLREHLRAVPAPADNVDVLAELLGEDLAPWPAEGWLVLDDYHELARGADAERFVEALVLGAPLNILIASRQRPSWVSARGILYGEVFELNQVALAMDAAEASEVLVDESEHTASGLVALANGWPAVIGLAAVSGASIRHDVEQVPESLYRFFAEEVYASLEPDVQEGLATLAIAPIIDRDVADVVLGEAVADRVCAAALDVGILVERGSQLELHPLCRSFLAERSEQIGFVPRPESLTSCLEHYHGRREWDAAFELIARHGLSSRLGDVLRDALDELLETARLSTLETWCDLPDKEQAERPVFRLARAEVALRRGRYTEAQSSAESASADADSELAFRSLSVAGRAAHLASREEDGLELYRRAEHTASTDDERRDALWGQFICAVDLELPEATDSYFELRRDVRRSDPREVVRAAAYGLSFQVKSGAIDPDEADRVYELLPSVSDALIVSSFQSTYSVVLGLSARYSEALDISEEFLETARRYRLDFAKPYALCSRALAFAGLRQWGLARVSVDEASAIAKRNRDSHVTQLAFALLTRLLVQQGHYRQALSLETPALRGTLPSARAEVLSSRALALASAARVDEALALIESVRNVSRAVEPLVLIAAVEAVCSLKSRDSKVLEHVLRLESTAFDSGAVDLLITTYRSNPEILALLLKAASDRDRAAALVRRVGDGDLADKVGHPVADDLDPRARLTPREREVYEFLVRGVSDNEIASALFISPATAKRHALNIYNKIGIRSRTAIAVHAALERANQATSATDEGARGES